MLAPLLEAHAITLPATQEEALAIARELHHALTLRGLAWQSADGVPHPMARQRCELFLGVAHALAHCDLRGLPFAFAALRAALELGDESLLQRALAVFVITTAPHMHTALIAPALALCAELTPGRGSYALALLHAAEAEAAHMTGRFMAAESGFEKAERLLVESCVGATRELSTVRNGAAFVWYAHKGDFASAVPRTTEWLRDAEAREDFFHVAILRVAHAICWIAHDEPERARSELSRAEAEWPGADGFFEVVVVLYLDIVDRYQSAPDAHRRPAQGRRHVLDGMAVSGSFLSGYVELHRAWGGLRALACQGADDGALEEVEQAIERLEALGPDSFHAIALAFRANLLHLRRQSAAALLALERSEQTFRRANMLCMAAIARHRRGELSCSAFGDELVRSAEQELRALGVAEPARWCAAYFSPYPVARSGLTALDES